MDGVGLKRRMFNILPLTSAVGRYLRRASILPCCGENNIIIRYTMATQDSIITTMDTSEEFFRPSLVPDDTWDRIIFGLDYGTTGTGKILNRRGMK